jgi:hypothetical protein
MPAAITTLRSTLATTLTNAGVWSVFSFPPATLLANAVVITPSDPYLTPSNNDEITISPMANFKIMITKPALDNQGNLAGIEDYILAVVTKLAAATLPDEYISVSAPSIISAASGDLLVSEITVSILTSGVKMSYKGFTEEETKFLIKIGQINKPEAVVKKAAVKKEEGE